MSGIGSLERPTLRFANQADEVVLPEPYEVITLAGSITRDGDHLCHGSRFRSTMELLLVCPQGWQMGRERDAATGHLELTISPWPPHHPPLPGSPV